MKSPAMRVARSGRALLLRMWLQIVAVEGESKHFASDRMAVTTGLVGGVYYDTIIGEDVTYSDDMGSAVDISGLYYDTVAGRDILYSDSGTNQAALSSGIYYDTIVGETVQYADVASISASIHDGLYPNPVIKPGQESYPDGMSHGCALVGGVYA